MVISGYDDDNVFRDNMSLAIMVMKAMMVIGMSLQ